MGFLKAGLRQHRVSAKFELAISEFLELVWPKVDYTHQAILASDRYFYMLTNIYFVAKLPLTLNWRYIHMVVTGNLA